MAVWIKTILSNESYNARIGMPFPRMEKHIVVFYIDLTLNHLSRSCTTSLAYDKKEVYSRSDLEPLKHSLSFSWTWSAQNELTLTVFKIYQMAIGHQRSSLEIKLDLNGTSTSNMMVHYIMELGVNEN